MLPTDLTPADFAEYPPQARNLAVAHLAVLRQLPLSFVPGLLGQLIEYQWMFPAEQASFDQELDSLSALTSAEITEWFHVFSQIHLLAADESFDWVNQPARFTEHFSAYLWSSHQMDLFRSAAISYNNRVRAAAHVKPLPMRRLGIAVIGQGVSSSDLKLFQKLREHGTYFSHVNPDGGLNLLLATAASRAQAHPAPYAHWYVDGGTAESHNSLLTSVSYEGLAPVRTQLLQDIQLKVQKPGMGPEELHSSLARLSTNDLGMGGDGVLERFQIKLLTEGSGTQIFSTTFAQWTTREVLRRAEPLTLLVRFAPRQRERPMSELLSDHPGKVELDAVGSLVDADMASYYHWINQQRLSGSRESSFVVWFEGQAQAVVISPSLPRGAQSTSPMNLGALVSLIS